MAKGRIPGYLWLNDVRPYQKWLAGRADTPEMIERYYAEKANS